MEEQVTISKSYYEQLLRSERKLEILGEWGVDNWGGYGDAMSQFYEEEGED